MEKIIIHKASDLHERKVESITIEVNFELPDFNSLSHAELIYEEDSRRIDEVLFNSLPQGTRYRLAIRLMRRVVSENYYKGTLAPYQKEQDDG